MGSIRACSQYLQIRQMSPAFIPSGLLQRRLITKPPHVPHAQSATTFLSSNSKSQTCQHQEQALTLTQSKRYFSSNLKQMCVIPNSAATQSPRSRTIFTSSADLALTSSPSQKPPHQELVTSATMPDHVTTAAPAAHVGEASLADQVECLSTLDTVTESGVESVSVSLLFPDFPTIHMAEVTIQKLHELTGLPWWATIVLTAFTLRLVLIMPLSVYSLHNAEKLNRLQPEVTEIAKRLKVEVAMAMHQFKWDEKKAKEEYVKNMKRLLKDLQIRNNCHPMKNTASFWLQLPLWISVSYSLRNMSSRAVSPNLDHHAECHSLTAEGTLWFPDLTMTDTTFILPILMGGITLFNIEMTHLTIGEMTKYRKRLTVALRCLALLFIPISSTMPSAMVLYWISSGSMAAAQNILHDYTPFRRFMGLGHSQTESNSPTKALARRAKMKYFNK